MHQIAKILESTYPCMVLTHTDAGWQVILGMVSDQQYPHFISMIKSLPVSNENHLEAALFVRILVMLDGFLLLIFSIEEAVLTARSLSSNCITALYEWVELVKTTRRFMLESCVLLMPMGWDYFSHYQ